MLLKCEIKTILKSHHRKFKVMLSYVQSKNTLTHKQLIEDVFRRITDIHSVVDYTEPLDFILKDIKNKWSI